MNMLGFVDPWPLSLVFIAVFAGLIGGLIRGYSGFGFGMASVPIFMSGFIPAEVVPAVLFMEVLIGLFSIREVRAEIPFGSLKPLALGTLIGTPIGMAGLHLAPVDAMRIFIALAMLVFAVVLALNTSIRFSLTQSTLRIAGFASGLLNGSIAASGPPVIVLLMGSALPAVQVRALLITFILLSGLLGVVSVLLGGLATLNMVFIVLVMAPGVMVGVAVGSYLFKRLNSEHYRLIGLILIGLIACGALISALLNT